MELRPTLLLFGFPERGTGTTLHPRDQQGRQIALEKFVASCA